jgi:hypothetical protein
VREHWNRFTSVQTTRATGLPYNCLALTGSTEFEEAKWDEQTSEYNNCYNYALNIATGKNSVPGQWKTRERHDQREKSEVNQAPGMVAGAILDGLTFLGTQYPPPNACPQNCHMVALYVRPGEDFHWARRDKDGTWSHKEGKLRPAKITKGGQPVTDPRDCPTRDGAGPAARQYEFCGVFCVCVCHAHPEREGDKTSWRDRYNQ